MKNKICIIDSGVYRTDGCTIKDVLDQLPSSIDKKDISFEDIICESKYDGNGCPEIEFTVKFPIIEAVSKDTIRERLSELDDKYFKTLQINLGVLFTSSKSSKFYRSAPFKFYGDYDFRKICGGDGEAYGGDGEACGEESACNCAYAYRDKYDEEECDEDEHNIKNIIGGRGYFTPEQFHEEVDKLLEIQKNESAN